MKQVTMESVKQRIADLESAGKVVGGLSLSSEFELACLRELVAVTEQRDALVVEMSIVKNDYATIPEVKCIGWPNTPNFDAAIAALRAEGFDSAFDEEPFGHIRRCGAFVIIEVNGDPHIKDGMPVFARQLRESKGEVQS